jgi:predicted permease
VLLGRDFTRRDVDGAPKVAIVNQKFVKRYFPKGDALGRHIGMGIDPGTKTDITIVGVVGDTKYENMREEIPEEMYVPYAQKGFANNATVYVRPMGDPTRAFNLLRSSVAGVDTQVAMYDLRTLDRQVEISLLTERLLATLSTVFGCLATLLAALGLYGVMAFMVTRRTREIGIRMALGAGRRSVVWMVLRETLTLAAFGVGIGLVGAYGVTRLIQAQLFGVRPTDLLTMSAASIGIAGVTALAGFLPARRATAIDPMRALRWE